MNQTKIFLCSFVFILLHTTSSAQINEATNFSMSPYSGPWTVKESSHLLRRALFGPTYAQIQNGVTNGMDATVDQLLLISNWTDYPLGYQAIDTSVAIGSTWINSVYPATNKGNVNSSRERSLICWKLDKMMQENATIAQKMDLFWHNHFAVELPRDARTAYAYFELIRTHSLGNFKTLIKEMTVQPAMLEFLNGEDNVGSDPNENYSRELLELYSIGKGPGIGVGDYSRYTEQDVTEGARILSGYSNVGIRSETITMPYSEFTIADHDNTPKTLSYHFNGVVISPNGATEYENYIDTIFAQPEFASFICESIYHFFVNDDITPEVQNQVISEMEITLIANNFEILPVMSQLLKSEHFYDLALRGCLLKSPMDFMFSMYNPTEAVVNFNQESDYKILNQMATKMKEIGMDLSAPPSVAGWPAYYQAPAYSRHWLSAVFLQNRHLLISNKIAAGAFYADGNAFRIDAVSLVNTLSNPASADAVIDDLIEIFLADDINTADRDLLLNTLTDNLPAFEWTVLYNDYLLDPVANEADLNNQVKATLGVIFKLYMFQTF